MKRFVILFVLVVLFVLIGLVVGQRSQRRVSPPDTKPPPQIVAETPPRTVDFPPMPSGASFLYAGPEISAPPQLPIFQTTSSLVGRPAVEQRALSFAQSFGFTASPSATWRGTNFAAVWEPGGTSTLTISFNKSLFSLLYELRTPSTTALLLEHSPQAIASFIASRTSLPPAYSLNLVSTQESGFDGLIILDRPLPRLTGYNFGLFVNAIPLLTPEYTEVWARVIIDEGGRVRSFSSSLPPEQVTPTSSATIISVDDAVATLNAGNGLLLWAGGEGPSGYGVTPSFQKATITSAQLVYIPTGNVLRPGYLFEGSGETRAGVQTFGALVFASR